MKSQAKFDNFYLKNALENGICEIALNLPRSNMLRLPPSWCSWWHICDMSGTHGLIFHSTHHNAPGIMPRWICWIFQCALTNWMFQGWFIPPKVTPLQQITLNPDWTNGYTLDTRMDFVRLDQMCFWQPRNSGHISWLWPTIAWLIGFIAID